MSAPKYLEDYYFLHVNADGSTKAMPVPQVGMPCLRVRVMPKYEEATTRDDVVWDAQRRKFQQLPKTPPGDGWIALRCKMDQRTDETTWRRPR
jgi:hypothetical protein